jgi:MYXO-CTERM domain-containing protein
MEWPRFRVAAPLALLLTVVVGCSGRESDLERDDSNRALRDQQADREALASIPSVRSRDLCADGPGIRCLGKVVTNASGEPLVTAAPAGFGAQDIQQAYGLPSSGGNGRVVAFVVPCGGPDLEKDLESYRTQFGLPACTTLNGCLQIVDQAGNPTTGCSSSPAWTLEAALGLDMISATCPDCKILLVASNIPSGNLSLLPFLAQGVATAARMGASVIATTYMFAESEDVPSTAPSYNQPNALVVAAAGNDGYMKSATGTNETNFPASLPYVLAVGGTTLAPSASTRGWAEAAWKSTASGCSKAQPKPAWQTDTGCATRTVADVAAVAFPPGGVAYYQGGWKVILGTDVSTSVVAGILGLFNVSSSSWVYAHASMFFDVTSGSNGTCGNYLCNAGVGYDGPTGIGSPNGSALARLIPDASGGSDVTVDRASGGGTGGGGGSMGTGGVAGGVGTSGAGGSAGQAGASGTVGTSGTAGMGGTSATSGASGTVATGGSSGVTGGSSGVGATGSGGSNASAGATPGDAGETDKGCACTLATTPNRPIGLLAAIGMMLLLTTRRRRVDRGRRSAGNASNER